jgi:hypothetical protein
MPARSRAMGIILNKAGELFMRMILMLGKSQNVIDLARRDV